MGTLRDRYEIYVRCQQDLGLEYVSFDDWMNNNASMRRG